MMLIALKKFWSWLKAYWYVPVIIVIAIVVTIIMRKVPLSLMRVISKRREIHEKEVEAIDKIHAEEIEKREKALETYHETIKKIEEKYEKDSKELTSRKKKKIKKIVEKTHDNPDELAKQLSEQMGFEIVYPKE